MISGNSTRGSTVFGLSMFLAGVVLFLGGSDALAQAGRARQRMSNGGFEKGLDGWTAGPGHRIVEDPAQAHGGVRCLSGEVSRPKHGRVLRRKIKLWKNKLYRLSVWARADNGSRLMFWVISGGKKEVIGSWQRVQREWHRYRANFTVSDDGPVVVGIVAPSSSAAPIGRMWIDDVSLVERPLWPHLKISGERGFDDFPAMVKSGPDSAWVAWISYRDGHDTLQAARLEPGRLTMKIARRWEIEGQAQILNPCLISAGPGAWLVYAREDGLNWDVFAAELRRDGPRKPLRVTRHPGVDVEPAAVFLGDRLWIAWESNRDSRRQIYLTAVRAGRPGKPRRLSSPGSDNYSPALAAAQNGRIQAVWHSFRRGNFDLYGRTLDGGGLGPERRLTRAAGIDRDARLTAHGDEIWLAWEHASYSGYRVGRASAKRVLVARLDALAPGRLRCPRGLGRGQQFAGAEAPRLALDRQGRPWVAARVPRDRNSGWDVMLWRYAGDRWLGPWLASMRKGRSSSPGLAVFGRRALILYQSDDTPGRWASVPDSERGDSHVLLATVRSGGAPSPGPPILGACEEPKDRFEAAAIRERWGEEREGWNVEYDGRKLRLFFGDLHEHSDLSVCDRANDDTPDQSYQMMRDLVRCDFGALTDHGKCFNAYYWNYLGKVNRANTDPGRFLTLRAQEWSSSFEHQERGYRYGYYGHRNIVIADPFFPHWFNPEDGTTPAELWNELVSLKADFVTIPHQLADTGNVPVDWGFHDEVHEPVAEIYQYRGSYECRGCPRQAARTTPAGHFLQDAWARGLVIGVLASPDHHGGMGKAAVYAPRLSAESIVQSLRQRRSYGTTGPKIFLDVRVNGHFMGELGALPDGKPVEISVRADCPAPIRAVEICRNNVFIFKAEVKGKRCRLTYLDDDPPDGAASYYVRLTQRDGEMAWSSPVFLGRRGPGGMSH
ncbi:MAG TPA: carbohydrate binding domain-containing protein [Myxococcota bacterium]|nr:carbohydrate binding domain-containing protein [Myxococcota bacterium]